MSSLPHLQQHHGDFARFRDVMVETSPGRFGPIWWGVWQTYVDAPDAPPVQTVVDLGTGPGLLLPQLRARYADARIVGVEVQPDMLETATRSAADAGAELVRADLNEPVPLPDGVADVVSCVMVFHELAFPPPLLEECMRLLKPGGHLVLYDWVRRPLAAYMGDDPVLTPDRLQHFSEHCLFAADDVDFLLERAGFQIQERVGRRGARYAIWVCRKPDPVAR